jgi:short-subunit dehydrogenase
MQVARGTRAFVTGASRGIGRALAGALAARGATLGLAARSTDDLAALAAQLPGDHHVLECDVADAASTQAAVDGFAQRAGGLDLLVANAGITHYGPFRDQPLDQALQMSQVNWHGTLHTVHFGLPHLLEADRGHIVVVSSGAGLRSFPQAAVYGATKAAQRMFAEALRHELADTGVSLTTVYPGEIATSLHDHEKDRMPAWYRGGPQAAAPEALAQKIVTAIEDDERAVYYPPLVRALGSSTASTPRLATPSCAACAATAPRPDATERQPGVRWRGGSVRSLRASSARPSRASPRNSREAGDNGALARETNANVV